MQCRTNLVASGALGFVFPWESWLDVRPCLDGTSNQWHSSLWCWRVILSRPIHCRSSDRNGRDPGRFLAITLLQTATQDVYLETEALLWSRGFFHHYRTKVGLDGRGWFSSKPTRCRQWHSRRLGGRTNSSPALWNHSPALAVAR